MKLTLKGLLVTSLLLAIVGIGSILSKKYSLESLKYLIAFSGVGHTLYAQTIRNSKFVKILKGTKR
ncbi:hypothetical protein ABC382_00800 [Lysinibacillus sp. 1P01SD]|uniref:hypothetical protein n=1 Tax=Lysinibacillus sp. 1P01SD TaxID=3132285 RepID=UPI0039A0411F